MVRSSTLATAVLALAGNGVSAARLLGTEKMSFKEIHNLTQIVDRAVLEAHSCRGQSCLIADTAGVTGNIPIMKAEGASDADVQCIVKYNPDVGKLLANYNNNPPLVPKQPLTGMSTFISGINNAWRPIVAANGNTETGTFDAPCAPNILIFAKGTMEPSQWGITIGPKLKGAFGSDWSVAPVDYDADIPGDYCLGLPGGQVAKTVINAANRKCPNSNLFLSGYSQGAMVVRVGLARADPSAKAKVKGLVTFGDPFNGAPVVGYNGPIKIFCGTEDGVCSGNFELRPAHLAYVFDDTVTQAISTLKAMAQGQGDQSCCIPGPKYRIPTPAQWKASIAANGGVVPVAGPGVTVEQWAQALSDSNGGIPRGTANTGGKLRRSTVDEA